MPRLTSTAAGSRLAPAAPRAQTEVDAGLEPAKRIFVHPAERVAGLAGRRQIRVTLSAELLAAAKLALIPFAGSR